MDSEFIKAKKAKLEAVQDFHSEIEVLLSPKNPTFNSLYFSISRWLSQFKLNALYSPAYVINEAYLRGETAICNGVILHNKVAWLRRVSFNIIRELHREESKYLSLPDENLVDPETADKDFNLDLDQELMRLKLAFQVLDPEDKELLNLKIVDGLSWKEIQKEFSLRGKNIPLHSLRKRKERALRKLRDSYDNFKSSFS